jgi:3-carboxy-cis,cis-muconate cycloisomerase
MAVSAFDDPWLAGLVGDDETARLVGDDAEMAAMLAFEAALAAAEARHGVIPPEAARAIGAALAGFRPDIGGLRDATERDGVVVPELVRQLRATVGAPHAAWLHFGATSQDVIDTALVLRVKRVLDVFAGRIEAVVARLDELAGRIGARELPGRTRMQAAVPITAGVRIASWRDPLVRQRERLDRLRPELLVVQFGGAAGTLDKLGGNAAAVRAALAEALDLGDAPQWHSQRDRIGGLGSWLSQTTAALGKLGQDVALMAQGEEIALRGGGGSSAMPHKRNPVGAEVLVALARFNAAQLGALHQALVHEQERSGSAWTLEWLVLPPMLAATGAALRLAGEVTGSIESIGR